MTILTSLDFTTITCPGCAGSYAILRSYQEEARILGGFKECWSCPYCKETRGYGKSQHALDLAAKERELQDAIRSKDYYRKAEKDARAEAAHFRASRDGMKGALNKTKKRVAHGVCPCCNRVFKQLAAHMKNKHPEMLKGEP